MIVSMLKKFNLYNTIIIFLLAVVVIYQIHRWTNGLILSSSLFTFIIFFSLLAMFSFRAWPWMRLKVKGAKDYRWLLISILTTLLIISLWVGRELISGDYNSFIRFALQLLNGFTEGHNFYKGAPGYYTFVPYTALAIFSNIIGWSVHYSFIAISILISFFIPLASYRLAQQLGFSSRDSFFFAGLVALYGGFGPIPQRMFSTIYCYLPAIQISMPFISRNMNFLLFLLFLSLWFKMYQTKEYSYNISINLGILTGIAGLTHPQSFILIMLFLSIWLVINIWKKELIRYPLISMFIGTGFASFYYIPLILTTLNYGGLVHTDLFGEKFPTNLWLYGPLPVLAIYGAWKQNEWKGWMRIALFVAIFVIISRIILLFFMGTSLNAGWVIFRIHRFAPHLFIFLALFATLGLKRLFK